LARTYRKKIEAELKEVCGDVLEVLDKNLVSPAKVKQEGDEDAQDNNESVVFYLKMKGDYYR